MRRGTGCAPAAPRAPLELALAEALLGDYRRAAAAARLASATPSLAPPLAVQLRRLAAWRPPHRLVADVIELLASL